MDAAAAFPSPTSRLSFLCPNVFSSVNQSIDLSTSLKSINQSSTCVNIQLAHTHTHTHNLFNFLVLTWLFCERLWQERAKREHFLFNLFVPQNSLIFFFN
jgi:hypothetical protein